MKPVTGNFTGYRLTGNRLTTLLQTTYMWEDYNLPHAQSHSVYIAYEFTTLNCRITTYENITLLIGLFQFGTA